MNTDQVAALAALANGIIPADQTDDGAAAVNAGARLTERIEAGTRAALYLQGLEMAQSIAREAFGCKTGQLSAGQVERVLASIREKLPAFFAQLRMDVCALYLSDPDVWRRIGFPGPSILSGGYPDFAQPQTQKLTKFP